MGPFETEVVCKYVQIWLVLVVCNVVWGNFAIKTDIKKSAEICGNSWLGQACKYRE